MEVSTQHRSVQAEIGARLTAMSIMVVGSRGRIAVLYTRVFLIGEGASSRLTLVYDGRSEINRNRN
jgi:hypothetical protein